MLKHDDIARRAHCELQGMIDISTHDLQWVVEEYLAKAAQAVCQGETVALPYLGLLRLDRAGQYVIASYPDTDADRPAAGVAHG